MKLHKLTFGILAAVAAFVLGISAYAVVGFAQSFLPTTAERTVVEAEPASEAIEPAEPIFVGPSLDDENVTDPQPDQEFDPTGTYYLDVEKVPKGFAEIEYLGIESNDYTYDSHGAATVTPIAPKGLILTKNELKFERVSIGSKNLVFQTATVNGVSYKFSGTFQFNSYCDDGDTPDLKGRLIKIKDNKWAAEMEAEFYLHCGC